MAIFTDKFEINLPKSINSELKFIEKGIISHQINKNVYFIFKDRALETQNIHEIKEISVEFDPILRDEFPSVRMIIRFFDNTAELFNTDHYFSIESAQELEHLYDLSSSKSINIVFNYDNTSVCSKYALNKQEIETINKTIAQINS